METWWFTSDTATEVAWYPDRGRFLVTNNTYQPVSTTVTGQGRSWELELEPMGWAWVDVED